MSKGIFIAFEGIDGSGKSTQIQMLTNRIQEEGIRCYQTCEPSGGPIGSLTRQILTGRIKTDNRVIAAMFAADRLDHLLNEVDGIVAKIEDGITVITDRYYFSSYWGWRASPFTGKRTFHGGIDMAANTGTPVYAALHGTVVAAGWDNTYGNFVRVKHHSGYTTLYAHLSKISVKKGASVGTETKLGEVGSTGLSTGPHLHFSVYKNGVSVNPQNLWN